MVTNESGEITPEQLASMDSRAVVALIRRNSGDPNFYWRVREAVLNRAADEIERLAGRAAEPGDEHCANCDSPRSAHTCIYDVCQGFVENRGEKHGDGG